MGGLCAVLMMVAIFVITWTVSRWDAKTAYRLFEHSSQHFFEPESVTRDVESPVAPVSPVKVQTHFPVTLVKASVGNHESSKRLSAGKRPYISPLVKKRIAARQKWRCAICKQLLDETFELDHIRPLFKGGHPTDESNLQALCKRDHLFKSAVSDRA